MNRSLKFRTRCRNQVTRTLGEGAGKRLPPPHSRIRREEKCALKQAKGCIHEIIRWFLQWSEWTEWHSLTRLQNIIKWTCSTTPQLPAPFLRDATHSSMKMTGSPVCCKWWQNPVRNRYQFERKCRFLVVLEASEVRIRRGIPSSRWEGLWNSSDRFEILKSNQLYRLK